MLESLTKDYLREAFAGDPLEVVSFKLLVLIGSEEIWVAPEVSNHREMTEKLDVEVSKVGYAGKATVSGNRLGLLDGGQSFKYDDMYENDRVAKTWTIARLNVVLEEIGQREVWEIKESW